jgi:peroxiredoxin
MILAACPCFLLLLSAARAADPVKVPPGHNLLTESAARPKVAVGDDVGSLSFKDVQGKSYYLEDLATRGPVVFVFLSTECPVAQRYSLRLARLHKDFSAKGVSLVGVYANEEDSKEKVAAHAKEMGLSFPVVRDAHGHLARRLGATMTPQAFLIDAKKALRYRGAIDDNRYEDRVKQHYLRDALAALLEKKPVATAQTDTPGCTLHLPTAATVKKVTYAGHVARVLQDNCVGCHRRGQVAPFTLESYEQARRWAKEIKAYTQARLMPPWKPEPGFGDFIFEKRMSDDEVALIRRWVDDGTPQGDEADLPPPPRFTSEWALGKPDLVVEMPEEYTLGAEGEDDYRHFIIPTNFDKDVYVEAVDVRPGNPRVVHHVLVYVDKSGQARELDKADPGPGYSRFGGPGFEVVSTLGGWAPGTTVVRAPEGTGQWLPKGGDIVLQVHYYRTGKVEKDRTRVALYFSKAPKPVRIFTGAAHTEDIAIPAGAKRHEVKAEWELKRPVYALGVFPHMHLLGKEMKVTAHLPDGKVLPLIWVKNWDFKWQTGYRFKEALFLPKGTVIKSVAYYDNSADNPNNPHKPPKLVTYGEKTTDEMCIAFVSVVGAAEYEALLKKP